MQEEMTKANMEQNDEREREKTESGRERKRMRITNITQQRKIGIAYKL